LTFHPNQAETRMERSGNHTSSFAVIQLSKTRLPRSTATSLLQRPSAVNPQPFFSTCTHSAPAGRLLPSHPVPRGPGHPSTPVIPRQHVDSGNFPVGWRGEKNSMGWTFYRSQGSSRLRRTASWTWSETPLDLRKATIPPARSTVWKTTSSHSGWTTRPALLRTDCM